MYYFFRIQGVKIAKIQGSINNTNKHNHIIRQTLQDNDNKHENAKQEKEIENENY